jgi:hypothetical protein
MGGGLSLAYSDKFRKVCSGAPRPGSQEVRNVPAERPGRVMEVE